MSNEHLDARDNTKEAQYWVAHRMGPFLVHRNQGDNQCVPQQVDNPGYGDDLDILVLQGFMICPSCKPVVV